MAPVRPPDVYGQERGVGVVFLRDAFLGGPSGSDTVVVLERPEVGAALRARLILVKDSLTWDYRLETGEPAVEGAALEHGYEEWGLPVLPPRGDASVAGWLEVRWGTGEGGEPLTGWVRFEGERLDLLSWEERLAEVPLYFLDPDAVRFFDAPDGSDARVELVAEDSPQRFDYILHPLESRGPWMRVELVTPSDYCADPEAPRRDTVWVRHLDETGRPRVWYHTRGC